MSHSNDSEISTEALGEINARFSKRARLIREKLDPKARWEDPRRPEMDEHGNTYYCVEVSREVDRNEPRVVKSMRGYMGPLQEHETRAYMEIFLKSNDLVRIATFQKLEGANNRKVIELKDYGPSLADWLTLTGPPRFGEDFYHPHRGVVSSPVGPWLDPPVILSLVRSLLEALEPFHKLGFVHCDAKEDNFCISFKPESASETGPLLSGEIDLDTLTAIDLGCCLLPQSRKIHSTDKGAPLYIGAYREAYIWPVLMGGAKERTAARQVATRYANGEFPARLNIPRGRETLRAIQGDTVVNNLRYISDNYLLACEMATLGEPAALDKLDWRIDFFSLGQLLKNVQSSLISDERKLAEAAPEVANYLEALPQLLQSFDTSPFESAPEPPHGRIIKEINDLIGKDRYRRIPFRIVEAANPIPWYSAPAESPFSNLSQATLLAPPSAALAQVLSRPTSSRVTAQPPAEATAAHCDLKDFQVFRDFPDGPEMVALPAGEFMMGSPEGKGGSDEHPQHLIHIDYRFAAAKYPVTFVEWDAFALETGGYQPDDEGWGRGRRPVINVSWEDAQTYIKWLNKKTGKSYRLLSEAEWEYAVRAGTATAHSTGETITTDQANFDGRPNGQFRGRTTEVDLFPPNPWGIHDMHGNVWEWVEDVWMDTYVGAPSDGSAWLVGNASDHRVLRGGSWEFKPQLARSACRWGEYLADRDKTSGFRLARMLPAKEERNQSEEAKPMVSQPTVRKAAENRNQIVAGETQKKAGISMSGWAWGLGAMAIVMVAIILVPSGVAARVKVEQEIHRLKVSPINESAPAHHVVTNEAFNHNKQTSYLLLGKHADVKCHICHKEDQHKDKLKTYCFSCHEKDDKHYGQEGVNCETCHSESDWKITKFKHNTMSVFPLQGSHALVECKKCHAAPTFKDAQRECFSCHEKDDERTHKRRFGVACQECHGVRSWEAWDFDHNKTEFKLIGPHKPKGIPDCHKCHQRPMEGKVKTSKNCESCHVAPPSNSQKQVGAFTAANSQRFLISADGTEVTDNKTGLIWRRCAEGKELYGNTCAGSAIGFTHNEALQHAKSEARRTGIAWRVPEWDELASIVEKKFVEFGLAAINPVAFPETPKAWFWPDSASWRNYSYRTRPIDFEYGDLNRSTSPHDDGHLHYGGYVRLVRAGQ